MLHLVSILKPMMAPYTWHAIKIPSGLMQPCEDVEDTLPLILNDVVDFEWCLKKQKKYVRLTTKVVRSLCDN